MDLPRVCAPGGLALRTPKQYIEVDNVIHLLLTLPIAATGGGSGPITPPTAQARETRIEVTDEGAFLRQRHGDLQLDHSGSEGLTGGGTFWTYTDGGLAWIGASVAIGNVASQVFSQYDLNNEAAGLFSAYDSNPATPVWTDGTVAGTDFAAVDSAAETNTHVAISQVTLGGNPTTRTAVLRKYSSSSVTPDWVYGFAPVINAAAKVAISRDGNTIVAAIMNNNTMSVELAVFGPGSAIPVSYTILPAGSNSSLRGWDLSADGSKLYFSQGVTANILDVATGSIEFSTNIGASFDSHAISGDGSVFAFGNFNSMKVWVHNGATYVNTISKSKGGSTYCAELDISDDGSSVAYGWYFYSPGTTVEIEALDVATGMVTMTDTVVGLGTLQNTVAQISCNADGSRFGVGLWGDGGGQVDELRLYSSTQNAALQTLGLGGSVFGVDISADGQRLAGCGKAVHANTFGNGGHVDLIDAGGEDMLANGTPHSGATIDLEVHGVPGKTALLLSANLPQSPPAVFPGIGTLYVKRSALTISSLGQVAGNGELHTPLTMSGAVGTDLYLQVLFLSPRLLTTDYLKLTHLP
jgi:hypothetical protein